MQNKKCWIIINSDQRKKIISTQFRLYIIFEKNKRLISLFGKNEGSFFMNTEKNQEKWINMIHENLKLRGRSEKTFINYKCAIMSFLNYFSETTNIKSLKEADMICYLKEKFLNDNRSRNSYNLAIAAIKLLYIVCFNKTLNKYLLPSSKIGHRLPVILSKEKFIEIFNKEKILKHKCWLLLGFCSGLRVEEVSKVKVEDLDFINHKVKVIGKGNKERYTILPDISIKFLKLYCDKNNITTGYLFSGISNKEVMNNKTIINFFSRLKKTYNLDKRISFHSLRHSFATYFLINNGSLLTLQSMLGHTQLNTTTIYLHLAQNFNELEGIKYV